MKKEASAVIGNSCRIDERLLNPLMGRSPGPKYTTSKNMMNRTFSTTFNLDPKLKDVKVSAPNATRYSPNYNVVIKKPHSASFKNSHADWRATFTKEKERYMTCTSEPAK